MGLTANATAKTMASTPRTIGSHQRPSPSPSEGCSGFSGVGGSVSYDVPVVASYMMGVPIMIEA